MQSRKIVITQWLVFSFSVGCAAQNYDNTFIYTTAPHYANTQEIQKNCRKAEIWFGLKSGLSINKAKENSFFKSNADMALSSKSQTASNNLPFHLEVTRPFNDKFSGTISAIFMPASNVKLIAEELAGSDHATYYLNTKASSYGIMGSMNYEVYKYNNLSQYILVGAGAMLNTASNAELFLEYGDTVMAQNRTITLLNSSKINLAWQIGTGIKYAVNQNLMLEVGYLYLDKGKAKTKHAIDRGVTKIPEPRLLRSGGSGEEASIRLTSHQVLFGVEFKL